MNRRQSMPSRFDKLIECGILTLDEINTENTTKASRPATLKLRASISPLSRSATGTAHIGDREKLEPNNVSPLLHMKTPKKGVFHRGFQPSLPKLMCHMTESWHALQPWFQKNQSICSNPRAGREHKLEHSNRWACQMQTPSRISPDVSAR